MTRVLICLLILCLCSRAGQNGKLVLFGSEQHVPGVGNFSQNGGYPDPLWKPISQGLATGNQFPSNWYRDDFSFNDYVWQFYRGDPNRWAGMIKAATDYCAANGINGPCIQLHYPAVNSIRTKDEFIQYLNTLAPFLAPGTYEIATNETIGAPGNPIPNVEASDTLLDALGGRGATGYDGLIAMIKIMRQILPGVLLGINDTQICNSDDGRPIGLYHQAEAIRVYKLLADHGAALDWLGIEGYWENFQHQPGTDGLSEVHQAIDTVGAALVTTKGTGAPETIAFTEFTPGGQFCGNGGQFTTQKALWQAFLSMFAADQYVFGVTGPWVGFRRSQEFSDSNWFYDDTNRGGNDPDCAPTSNGHVTATLVWLQGFIPTVIAGSSTPGPTPTPTPAPGPTPGPVPTPTPAPTPTPLPSDDGTVITPGGTISDGIGNQWTITNGVIFVNGTKAGYSANVLRLAFAGGTIWQQNSQGLWWSWTGNGWSPSGGTSVSPVPGSVPSTPTFKKWKAMLQRAVDSWISANPPVPD